MELLLPSAPEVGTIVVTVWGCLNIKINMYKCLDKQIRQPSDVTPAKDDSQNGAKGENSEKKEQLGAWAQFWGFVTNISENSAFRFKRYIWQVSCLYIKVINKEEKSNSFGGVCL